MGIAYGSKLGGLRRQLSVGMGALRRGSEPISSHGRQALGRSHRVANPLDEYRFGPESIAVRSASDLVHKGFARHVSSRPTESILWVGLKSTGIL